MCCHMEGCKIDNYIHQPVDSTQWHLIDWKYKKFGDDPRSLRFALSTDGMNPFGQMSSSHNVWLVLLSIYNFPPWLCNKWKYMMMSILISGPHQPGIDINVYLRPLVYDLKTLWSHGFDAYTGTRGNPASYMVCCSARLLIYRVAVLCLDNVKVKRNALIA